MATHKTCTKCNAEKPLEDFCRQRGGKHGRRASCKTCAARSYREWRRTPAGRESQKRAIAKKCRKRASETMRHKAQSPIRIDRTVGEQSQQGRANLRNALYCHAYIKMLARGDVPREIFREVVEEEKRLGIARELRWWQDRVAEAI